MRELDLLHHIYAQNRGLPPHVIIPPGDDMAAVRMGGQSVLITTDQSADGVHFDLRTTSLELVGRKAMTRKLSDVAAMAALPVAAEVAAFLPRDFGQQRATQLFDAMRRTAEQYNCPLVGGDIGFWDHPLIITVTIIADPAGIEPVRRNGAKVGDAVCVTGKLGGSWTAPSAGGGSGGGGPHLEFEPRVSLARKMAACPGVKLHSMIDLSDGLATDMDHICEQSCVAAEIDADRLPLRDEARAASARDGKPAWMHAVSDGEDYELCFTVSAADAAKLPREIDGVPITVIGKILEAREAPAGSRLWITTAAGREPLTRSGWEHRS